MHGPGYEGRTTEKGNDYFDSFRDPRPVNPGYMGPRYPDPDHRHVDSRHVDQRQYPDHRYNGESRYSDPQYGDSRNFDPVYAGPRYAGQRYPNPRYQGDTRYCADQGHIMHSVDHGNPGVNSLENGLYPMQTVERGDIGGGGVGYGRMARMQSSEGIRQGHGRGRCIDGGIEMAHCWQLLEWAKLSGLEEVCVLIDVSYMEHLMWDMWVGRVISLVVFCCSISMVLGFLFCHLFVNKYALISYCR